MGDARPPALRGNIPRTRVRTRTRYDTPADSSRFYNDLPARGKGAIGSPRPAVRVLRYASRATGEVILMPGGWRAMLGHGITVQYPPGASMILLSSYSACSCTLYTTTEPNATMVIFIAQKQCPKLCEVVVVVVLT